MTDGAIGQRVGTQDDHKLTPRPSVTEKSISADA